MGIAVPHLRWTVAPHLTAGGVSSTQRVTRCQPLLQHPAHHQAPASTPIPSALEPSSCSLALEVAGESPWSPCLVTFVWPQCGHGGATVCTRRARCGHAVHCGQCVCMPWPHCVTLCAHGLHTVCTRCANGVHTVAYRGHGVATPCPRCGSTVATVVATHT
eukprot:gene9634-biopygen12242